MAEDGDVDTTNERRHLAFNYIKSTYFCAIHVDGAYGGLTPRGYIHAAVFNVRKALPQLTTQEFVSDTELGPETIMQTKGGITREIEADPIFDVRSAREMALWLLGKADELEKALAQVSSEEDKR